MNKIGHPKDRATVAAHMRELRAMWPTLKGDWTYRDWQNQVAAGGRSLLTRLTKFRRANQLEVA